MSELEEIFEVRGVRGLKLDHQSGREEESVKSEKQIPRPLPGGQDPSPGPRSACPKPAGLRMTGWGGFVLSRPSPSQDGAPIFVQMAPIFAQIARGTGTIF